jgi:hypothetical protein
VKRIKAKKELTMSKVVAVSIAVVLLVGSSAFGQLTGALNQIQNTNIGLGNTIQLLNGDQAASALQNLAVQNDQFSDKPHGSYASQGLFGMFAEIGHASGGCAILGLAQTMSAIGMQAQVVGDGVGPKQQGQSVTLLAGQEMVKTEGPGAGSGLHQIQLVADQEAGNVAGTTSESSAILGLQNADINGAATATGQVESTMHVTTVQSQASI